MPTEHVSGQLQFKVELTSTGPDGKCASQLCLNIHDFTFSWNLFSQTCSVAAGASPDSIIGVSSLNGAPGTPSDDEDLPHHLPGMVSAGPSPTGSQGSQGMGEGGATACPEKELPLIGAEGRYVEPESVSGHEMLQGSFSESLDAIEAPKKPGERPLGAASPKLRSSFPTHTRLSAMLHIDSDEDEERSGANDITPVPLSPLLMNGDSPDARGPNEDDPFPELQEEGVSVLEAEPMGGGANAEDVPPEGEAATEAAAGPDLEDVLEQDVFLEVEEVPFAEPSSHDALPEGGDIPEQGRVVSEEPVSEVDTCSMATAPQTAFSSSESCPITLTTAVVSSQEEDSILVHLGD